MGKTWRRRTDRYGKPIVRGQGSHPPASRHGGPLRACCDTAPREPHATGCNRMPAMCGDKVGFERRTEAEARAGRISGKTDLEMRVYRCPFCELFHLTTQAET